MNNTLFQQYFSFTTTLEKLKKLERFKNQFYWREYPPLQRYESVADHSWRLAILILLFENKLSRPFNIQKALKFALIHDLPEIIAGDSSPLGDDGTGRNTFAIRTDLKQDKKNKEKKAAEELFGMLPKDKENELMQIWLEYENQKSFEAKIVKVFDRIECELQVFEYRRGHVFPKHLDFAISYTEKYLGVDPVLDSFIYNLLKMVKKNYTEYTKK